VVIPLSRSPSRRELLEGLRGYFIIRLFVQAKAAWVDRKNARRRLLATDILWQQGGFSADLASCRGAP